MNVSLDRIRNNKTLINGGLFSLFSFFNRGIGFLLLILLANYITPAEYGELNIFNTLVMFLGYFAGLSTAGYLSVSFFKKSKEEFEKDFSSICIITLMTTSIITILFLIFYNYLSVLLKVEPIFLFIAIAITFFTVFVELNLDYLRVQEKISKYGLLSCSFAICNLLLSLYLVIGESLSWKGRVYAQMACCILYFFIAIICFYKEHLFCLPQKFSYYKTIILWGIPLIPHHASVWMRQGCDRYIIDSSHTIADVGLFSFALNFVNIIIMIGVAFNNTNSVNLYKTLSSDISGKEKIVRLKRKERAIMAIYITITLVIMLGGVTLVPVLLPQYSGSIQYFIVLSFYGFLQCLYFLYCNYLFYFNKTQKLMYITFGSSAIHLLLSLLLTQYNLMFTCIIYIISFGIMNFFVYIQSKKIINKMIA